MPDKPKQLLPDKCRDGILSINTSKKSITYEVRGDEEP